MNLPSAARGCLALLLLVSCCQASQIAPVNDTEDLQELPDRLEITPLGLKDGDDSRYINSPGGVCSPSGSEVIMFAFYTYHRKDPRYTVQEEQFTRVNDGTDIVLPRGSDLRQRVGYYCGERSCTESTCTGWCLLWIRDLRQRDSAEYRLVFLTNQDERLTAPVVTLTVMTGDLQVKVSSPSSTNQTSAVLTCDSTCSPDGDTIYLWYKNGQTVGQGKQYSDSINSEDRYSCGVKGHRSVSSPSVYGPKDTSVSSSPSGDIEEGSSVTLSCSSDANPAAQYTWFKEHEDSVEESGQNYTIANFTSELGGNYSCQARNAIGRHNSTFLSIHVTETSQITTTTAITIAAVFLIILLLILLFLWMRRKMASRKASGPGPGTVEEPLPVYENIELANLTNRSAPAAQREPIEGQDEHRHDASIHHISHAENQEAPRCSDQTDEAVYSVVIFNGTNTASEGVDQTEMGEGSVLYSSVQKPVAAAGFT